MLPETVAREIIASHQQRPRNRGELVGVPSVTLENPSCGDRVTVWVQLGGDTILDLRFGGKGCAISQASASLMTVALKGKTLAQARALAESFRSMVMGETSPEPTSPRPRTPQLGDLLALSGVSRLHARRKCALLPWRALAGLLSAPDLEGAAEDAAPADATEDAETNQNHTGASESAAAERPDVDRAAPRPAHEDTRTVQDS